MMNRFLLVTLISGVTHKIDLNPMTLALKKINPEKDDFLQAAMGTCQCGFLDETTTLDRRVWVAPSQIRTVEIVFEQKLKLS